MTDALRPLLTDLTASHPSLALDYYTAPQDAPPSIDDEETSNLSASVVLPSLISQSSGSDDALPLAKRYSGYLIACFSPHPLTTLMREETTAPVLNIFEAALLHARALAVPFGIVTTGHYWEAVLEDGARKFFCGKDSTANAVDKRTPAGNEIHVPGFVGVRSTGMSAIQLHSTQKEDVDRRIADASAELVGKGAKAIILGCAGMSGMEDAIRDGAQRHGREVRIIDGVRAGVVLLEGLARTNAV